MFRRNKGGNFNTDRVIDIEAVRQERRRKAQKVRELQKGRPAISQVRRQTSKNIRQRVVFCLAVVLVIIVIIASAYNIVALKIERTAAVSQLESLEREREFLKEELNKVGGKEYIEQQAREQLKMILPGETLYVLKGNEKKDEKTTD